MQSDAIRCDPLPRNASLTRAMDGDLPSTHELVDELRDKLLRVLMGAVDVVPSGDHDRDVERPDQASPTRRRSYGATAA